MRIQTIEYKVYTYDELSEKAKEKVKGWYLEGREASWFKEDCELYLSEIFPNSSLQVQFSLGYCQGDGLNIYGDIDLSDLWEKIKDQFTDKEARFISWALKLYGSDYTMENNFRYGYCMVGYWNFVENLIEDMEYSCIRGIKYDILEKFDNACKSYMEKLCDDFEKSGYDYFYEISDDELSEICAANGYEFTEDGSIF